MSKAIKNLKCINISINFKPLLGKGFAGYVRSSVKKNGNAKVIVDLESMLMACAHVEELEFKDIFCGSVLHEVGHAIEDLFDKSFSEKRIHNMTNKFALQEIVRKIHPL